MVMLENKRMLCILDVQLSNSPLILWVNLQTFRATAV